MNEVKEITYCRYPVLPAFVISSESHRFCVCRPIERLQIVDFSFVRVRSNLVCWRSRSNIIRRLPQRPNLEKRRWRFRRPTDCSVDGMEWEKWIWMGCQVITARFAIKLGKTLHKGLFDYSAKLDVQIGNKLTKFYKKSMFKRSASLAELKECKFVLLGLRSWNF